MAVAAILAKPVAGAPYGSLAVPLAFGLALVAIVTALEALITAILVFVVIAVATDERVPASAAGPAVGFALAVGVFIGGPVTGGPVIGGVVAAFV